MSKRKTIEHTSPKIPPELRRSVLRGALNHLEEHDLALAKAAADETDERATQLFTALTYVHDMGLGCLWRHDQDMKAPLLSPEVLNDLIEKHALRLEAQARGLEAEASAHAQRLLDSFREAPYVGQAAARALMEASKEDCDRLLANAAEARAAKVTVGEVP